MNASRLLLLVACLLISAAASAQTLTCSSYDMGRHFCRANTSNGVQMESAFTVGSELLIDGGMSNI